MITSAEVTVGRKVWYWCGEDEEQNNNVCVDTQAFDATVIYIEHNGDVRLKVTNHNGEDFVVEDVELHDPSSRGTRDAHGEQETAYATWMPYQKKQQDLEKEKQS